VKATILVAFVDALGILIAALILGVPLAPALAALVFLGAFIPIVGAFVSGFVAVIVALVALGWVKALIMLGCIILVMQVEGHVLQPFLLGRAVKLHPLAVILAMRSASSSAASLAPCWRCRCWRWPSQHLRAISAGRASRPWRLRSLARLTMRPALLGRMRHLARSPAPPP
jgi:hypothetical protein